jgi:circadian clock protein KaiB
VRASRLGVNNHATQTWREVTEMESRAGGLAMKYLIRLYVTGQTPRSLQAIANLKRICENELRGQYELLVVDVLERPQLAEDEKILATPTVVKELPHPIRRIIGDLSDSDRVLLGLDLRTYSSESEDR